MLLLLFKMFIELLHFTCFIELFTFYIYSGRPTILNNKDSHLTSFIHNIKSSPSYILVKGIQNEVLCALLASSPAYHASRHISHTEVLVFCGVLPCM
jgi:hypothetical protein